MFIDNCALCENGMVLDILEETHRKLNDIA